MHEEATYLPIVPYPLPNQHHVTVAHLSNQTTEYRRVNFQ